MVAFHKISQFKTGLKESQWALKTAETPDEDYLKKPRQSRNPQIILEDEYGKTTV